MGCVVCPCREDFPGRFHLQIHSVIFSFPEYPPHHLTRCRQRKVIKEFNQSGIFVGSQTRFNEIANIIFQNLVFFIFRIDTDEYLNHVPAHIIRIPHCCGKTDCWMLEKLVFDFGRTDPLT